LEVDVLGMGVFPLERIDRIVGAGVGLGEIVQRLGVDDPLRNLGQSRGALKLFDPLSDFFWGVFIKRDQVGVGVLQRAGGRSDAVE